MKNSIYAIIALPKKEIEKIENNSEFSISLVDGINGSCFFVTANKFITAHHVLNKEFYKDFKHILINSLGEIIENISIDFEDSNTDFCVGITDTPVNHPFKIPKRHPTFRQKEKFTAYGYSAKNTRELNIKLLKEDNKIKVIEYSNLILEKTK